jgi:hypothetical protein
MLLFWFLYNILFSGNVYKISMAALGGGRHDSWGQGPYGSAWINKANFRAKPRGTRREGRGADELRIAD